MVSTGTQELLIHRDIATRLGTDSFTAQTYGLASLVENVPFNVSALDFDMNGRLDLAVSTANPGGVAIKIGEDTPGTYPVALADESGQRTAANLDFEFRVPGTIQGRHIFYNNSAFDGPTPGAGPQDDNAIATDKSILLPGQAAHHGELYQSSRRHHGHHDRY